MFSSSHTQTAGGPTGSFDSDSEPSSPSTTNDTITIVHISDTHGRHNEFLPSIPNGDILIHSGDFSRKLQADALHRAVRDIDDFFGKLPHKHKILVAGNHEIAFNGYERDEIQSWFRNCIYLDNNSVSIEGLHIWGSPCNNSRGMGFSTPHEDRSNVWSSIPSDTDIVVTHMPPLNIFDLAWSPGVKENCSVCGARHVSRRHWGDLQLRNAILQRVRPLAHLYGHVHDETGVKEVEGVTFSNAAMDLNPVPRILTLSRAQVARRHARSSQAEQGIRCNGGIRGDKPVWRVYSNKIKHIPTNTYLTVSSQGHITLESKRGVFSGGRSAQRWLGQRTGLSAIPTSDLLYLTLTSRANPQVQIRLYQHEDRMQLLSGTTGPELGQCLHVGRAAIDSEQ